MTMAGDHFMVVINLNGVVGAFGACPLFLS